MLFVHSLEYFEDLLLLSSPLTFCIYLGVKDTLSLLNVDHWYAPPFGQLDGRFQVSDIIHCGQVLYTGVH